MTWTRIGVAAVVAVVACAGADHPPAEKRLASPPAPVSPPDAGLFLVEAALVIAPPSPTVLAPPVVPPAPADAVWLKGSTHVHAAPSGDSTTPIPAVIAWYEQHGYDFIALTDHNRVSEVDPAISTAGSVAARAIRPGASTQRKLIVLAGVELTHNPDGCQPPGDGTEKCRIHANLIGVTARPVGKLVWADRKTSDRLAKYAGVIAQQHALGGLAQVNHGQWYWGMTASLLGELARMGFRLVEIENAAFSSWMDGDATHPSMETLWDAVLTTNLPLWGVASDDAHHYHVPGKYPAGGAWIAVRARRDPDAILEAMRVGRFYASTGIELLRADVEFDGDAGALVVEVKSTEGGHYEIDLIENGARVATISGAYVRYALPTVGYVRAVVRRLDRGGLGQRAWVQPRWAR